MRRFAAIFVALAVILFAGGCHNNPTAQEKKVMAQLADSMETQCIGRYLIDLPESFRWAQPRLTLYYGTTKDFKTLAVQVISYNATSDSFKRNVAGYVERAGSDTLLNSNKSTLISTASVGAGVVETTDAGDWVEYYDNPYKLGRKHELHLLIGQSHILIVGSSYEGVDGANGDLSPAVKARMLKLARHIRPVDEPEKAGPGFCLGSVVVDSDNDYENADMTFLVAGHKDVVFSVWMTNQDNPSKTLHERLSSISALAKVIRRFSIFRSRDLQVAGIPARETLAKIAENRIEYQFAAELRPDSPSLATEGAQINLKTGRQLPDGRYVDSTLTQNEATAL